MTTSITMRVVKNARRKGLVVLTPIQWGSLSLATYAWRRRYRPHLYLPDRPAPNLWQHITVTYDTGRKKRSFKKDCRLVERIGNDRFSVGCSYNVMWDMKTGMIAIGQPFDARGAHTLNDKKTPGFSFDQNAVGLAIAAIGMPGDVPTEKAVLCLISFIKSMKEEGAISDNFDYEPHSLVAAKDCPTNAVRNAMPRIRRDVEKAGDPVAEAIRVAKESRKRYEKEHPMWRTLTKIIRLLRKF